MSQYKIFSGAMPTTGQIASIALSAATLKTLMVIKPGATQVLRVLEWGISLDNSAAGVPGAVELIETDVAATSLTAYVANDINKYDAAALLAGDPTTNIISVGTSSSGFNTSGGAEGTTTASRLGDMQLIAPTNQFAYQFAMSREFYVQAAKFLRVRAKFAATVNAVAWVLVEA